MPDMSKTEIPQNLERREDVAWEAADVTQKSINFFDAKPLVKKGLDFFIRGWRSRLAEFVGDPLCELASRANYDGLTGLPNRRALDQYFTREFTEAQRYKRPLTALMLDINGFKQFNDEHGHLFGDKVLQAAAGLLTTHGIRGSDFLARYGGDEFVIVMPQTKQEEAIKVAVRLINHLHENALTINGQSIKISLSIGIAEIAADNPKELMERVDKLMYEAKADDNPGGKIAYKKDGKTEIITAVDRSIAGLPA